MMKMLRHQNIHKSIYCASLLPLISLLVLGIGVNAEIRATGPPMEDVKQWNVLSYNSPWNPPAGNKDYYIPENVVATGIAIDYDRIFIATPRLFSGVPATLSVISRKDHVASPTLQAYPDWTFHEAGRRAYNCSDLGLVSVYRMRIDSCNRLWALDSGISRSLEDFEVTCPPKILVIDLATDQVVRRIDFPREVIRGETLYTNLVIDESTSQPDNHCDDVFAYITDTVEPAIVVYDSARDLTWRLSHPSMYPDPNFAQSNILGQKFTLMDGIVGLAFDANLGIVYFQPLATDRLFSVKTSALRAGPLPFGAELPVRLVGKKSSQGIGVSVGPYDGSIFFSPLSETAIAEWNPNTNKQKVLAYDPDRLQFVADIRTPVRDPGSVYVLSSRFHRYFLKNLDSRDINVRIIRLPSVAGPPQASQKPILNYASSAFTLENALNYPTSPASFGHSGPAHYSSGPTVAPLISEFVSKPSYVDNYFSSIKQPYRYEQVGVINKQVKSPFTALNTGENLAKTRHPIQYSPIRQYPTTSILQHLRPHDVDPRTKYDVLDGSSTYLSSTNFNDFNGLRHAKSVSYNSTIRF